jgi:hypothetical protein
MVQGRETRAVLAHEPEPPDYKTLKVGDFVFYTHVHYSGERLIAKYGEVTEVWRENTSVFQDLRSLSHDLEEEGEINCIHVWFFGAKTDAVFTNSSQFRGLKKISVAEAVIARITS